MSMLKTEAIQRVIDSTPAATTYPCTYNGSGVYGAWQFLHYVDPDGPVLVCDVHGWPAQWLVYDCDDDDLQGPCQWYTDDAYVGFP